MRVAWLKNWFKRGDPLRAMPGWRWCNRVANVLNDFQGVNCRIEKPLEGEGRGWRVIVDGSSDEDTGIDPPWGVNYAIDPRTHEIQTLTLGLDPEADYHTLLNFGTVPSPEPTIAPAIDRVCLWDFDESDPDDHALQWPTVADLIESAIGEWVYDPETEEYDWIPYGDIPTGPVSHHGLVAWPAWEAEEGSEPEGSGWGDHDDHADGPNALMRLGFGEGEIYDTDGLAAAYARNAGQFGESTPLSSAFGYNLFVQRAVAAGFSFPDPITETGANGDAGMWVYSLRGEWASAGDGNYHVCDIDAAGESLRLDGAELYDGATASEILEGDYPRAIFRCGLFVNEPNGDEGGWEVLDIVASKPDSPGTYQFKVLGREIAPPS